MNLKSTPLHFFSLTVFFFLSFEGGLTWKIFSSANHDLLADAKHVMIKGLTTIAEVFDGGGNTTSNFHHTVTYLHSVACFLVFPTLKSNFS